jgi:hypothetical protein
VGEAASLYGQALGIRKKAFGEDHPKTKKIQKKLDACVASL